MYNIWNRFVPLRVARRIVIAVFTVIRFVVFLIFRAHPHLRRPHVTGSRIRREGDILFGHLDLCAGELAGGADHFFTFTVIKALKILPIMDSNTMSAKLCQNVIADQWKIAGITAFHESMRAKATKAYSPNIMALMPAMRVNAFMGVLGK